MGRATGPALLVLLGMTGVAAQAQRIQPSDIELRAAYCIRFLHHDAELNQAAVDAVQKSIADSGPVTDEAGARRMEELKARAREGERKLRDTQRGLDRLMGYLTPKFPYLDSARVVAEFDKADADIAAVVGAPDIAARFEPCRKIDWLPY
jgi:hypothetical protein